MLDFGSKVTWRPATGPTATTPDDPFARGPISGLSGVPYADLAKALNDFMTQQAKAPFTANLPDYDAMVSQRSKTTGEQLQGQVPSDVISQLLQHGAEGGAGRGFAPGSPNTNSAYLRALGLTSIGQQEVGSKNLSQSIADTPVPQLFNPSSLFIPERLGFLGLGAAKAGLNRQPGNYGGNAGGYTSPQRTAPTGMSPWGTNPSPGWNQGPSNKGWNLPYGQVNSQGPSDFSDIWDQPSAQDEDWYDSVIFPGGGAGAGYDDTFNWGPADWTMYGD